MNELLTRAKVSFRRHAPRQVSWPLLRARMYWMSGLDDVHNFGDQLSPFIVDRLFRLQFKYSGIDAADLIAVGSLLNFGLTHMTGQTKPVVWGSGFILEGGPWAGHPVEWRAVRGELSRARVQHLTSRRLAVGDPGVLVPLAFPELASVPKRHRIGLVPHHSDGQVDAVLRAAAHPDVHVVNAVAPARQVLREIAACEVVLSSSLHGLVIADALDIPNAWTPVSDNLHGGAYKFADYYSGFQAEPNPQDLPEMVKGNDAWAASWRPMPGRDDQVKNLIEAFPAPRRPQAYAASPDRRSLVSQFD
ncbi:polysaccharide pyruvyl transferase family protein [Propionibacteriaceae bacterium G1746]|uniref:polysaccharide pyruvyl transferase family protein n=1 Tax=Aestuariimicrobium sp. G57 TaxID=3418485 RepID=UPI003C2890F7